MKIKYDYLAKYNDGINFINLEIDDKNYGTDIVSIDSELGTILKNYIDNGYAFEKPKDYDEFAEYKKYLKELGFSTEIIENGIKQ